MWFFFLFSCFLIRIRSQSIPNSSDLASVSTDKNNLDDNIVQIFNNCKCVIFYLCDEANYIIPPEEIQHTKVTVNSSLRSIRRLTCSNKFYYCCKNRTEIVSTTTSTTPSTSFTSSTIPAITTTSTEKIPSPRTYLEPSVQKNCGNWNESSLTEFPWTVAIIRKFRPLFRNTDKYLFICSGSLIHRQVVMTTHRCLSYIDQGSQLVVSAGNNTKAVSKIIKHSRFSSVFLYNDVALLVLDEPFDITPVCLPQPDQQFFGKKCAASAWVRHRFDQIGFEHVHLSIVDLQTCQSLLRQAMRSQTFFVHLSTLCAGGEVGDLTCLGGGGPLMCPDDDGRYVQVGVTSWGIHCGRQDVPGVYSDVAKFRRWIDKNLKNENLS